METGSDSLSGSDSDSFLDNDFYLEVPAEIVVDFLTSPPITALIVVTVIACFAYELYGFYTAGAPEVVTKSVLEEDPAVLGDLSSTLNDIPAEEVIVTVNSLM